MEFKGSVVFSGKAEGRIHILNSRINPEKPEKTEDPQKELERFAAAKDKAKSQIRELEDKMEQSAGAGSAEIFEIHRMMLDDPDYVHSVEEYILQDRLCAEYAVAKTRDTFAENFSNMDDDYMGSRDADVKDISNRVIRNLRNEKGITGGSNEPVILLSDDLLPSELSELGKDQVLALVTRNGSFTSHVALLARIMRIPSLNEVDFPEDAKGKRAVVDGERGVLIIED